MGLFCCFTPPASLQPPKGYNRLVPDVFPAHPLPLEAPISEATRRKIGKLAEYAQNNPHKIAKISRRLQRKIKAALSNPAQLGYVRIAVEAYRVLLSRSNSEGSSYTSSFFNQELFKTQTAVVPTLAGSTNVTLKALSADLLAAYVHVQEGHDNLGDVEPFIYELVKIGAAERACEALVLSTLVLIQEYVSVCHRLRHMPEMMPQLQAMVLDTMMISKAPADAKGTVDEVATRQASVCQAVVQELGAFTRDLAFAPYILSSLLSWLDQQHRWQHSQSEQVVGQLLQQGGGEQQFPVFSALVRHAASGMLPVSDCIVAVRWGTAQGLALPASTALPALSLALQQFPRASAGSPPGTAGENTDAAKATLRATIADSVRQLALHAGDAKQICDAISSALSTDISPDEHGHSMLDCCTAAASVIPKLPPQDATLPAGTLPLPLMGKLADMMSTWPASSRQAAQRLTLALLDPAARDLDDQVAAILLNSIWRQAHQTDTQPADFQALSQIVGGCVIAARPRVCVLAAKLALQLQDGALQGEPLGLSSSRRCALLLLESATVDALSQATGAAVPWPDVVSIEAQQGCPGLQRTPGETLKALDIKLAPDSGEATAEAALASVAASRKLAAFHAQLVSGLEQVPSLNMEYGDKLEELLSTPLAAGGSLQDWAAAVLGLGADPLAGSQKLIVHKLQEHFTRRTSMSHDRRVPGSAAEVAGDDAPDVPKSNGPPLAKPAGDQPTPALLRVLRMSQRVSMPALSSDDIQLSVLTKELEPRVH